MEKAGKITTILVLAVAFCFVLVSLTQSTDTTQGRIWAAKHLPNDWAGVKIPIWKITRNLQPHLFVQWVDHPPNRRFAIYDPEGDSNPLDETTLDDDLVLDKETGLIWARDANLAGETKTWQHAINYCRSLSLGYCRGWRLPTVEELSSLVDPLHSNPALPNKYPFIKWQSPDYWSSTTYESDSNYAWQVSMGSGYVSHDVKSSYGCMWPVRGGN